MVIILESRILNEKPTWWILVSRFRCAIWKTSSMRLKTSNPLLPKSPADKQCLMFAFQIFTRKISAYHWILDSKSVNISDVSYLLTLLSPLLVQSINRKSMSIVGKVYSYFYTTLQFVPGPNPSSDLDLMVWFSIYQVITDLISGRTSYPEQTRTRVLTRVLSTYYIVLSPYMIWWEKQVQ
jgi:hypothetical protein